MGKRALDVVVGTLLALLLLPVMIVLAVAAGLTYRAWPLFVHERIGEGGRRIRFIKLRSLPADYPKYATYDKINLNIPRFGQFIRRTHLDELPQLFLVPFGHLSLVGPRPAMPEDHEPVDPQYREARLAVPQGCTGLWQVGRHTDGLPSDAPEYDYFYVDHASMRLDLVILWWTALLMLGIRRARSLDEVPAWALRRRAPELDVATWGTGLAITSESPIQLVSQETP